MCELQTMVFMWVLNKVTDSLKTAQTELNKVKQNLLYTHSETLGVFTIIKDRLGFPVDVSKEQKKKVFSWMNKFRARQLTKRGKRIVVFRDENCHQIALQMINSSEGISQPSIVSALQ